jgi:hypothetical protein
MALGSFLRRRTTLRWAVPAGILATAAVAAVTTSVVQSGGKEKLADTTADALISAVHDARTSGYSGTMIAQMSLDLPVSEVPPGSQSPVLLMAGAHTMRYWYGGPQRQRVAMLAETSETDVFHVGTDIWQWNSGTRVATHSLLAPAAQAGIGAPISPAPLTIAALTPQQLAERTLAAIDGQTEIELHPGPVIADRRTYELVLEPGDSSTRIAAVHIDVDADRKVPLGVQVYARGVATPSIDVSFTSVTYKMPAAEYFAFNPPAGAHVQRGAQPQLASVPDATADGAAPATGWTAITEYRVGTDSGSGVPRTMQTLMTMVSGDWGAGSLLETPLLCMLVTKDGRVLAGSVDPAVLYAAAANG